MKRTTKIILTVLVSIFSFALLTISVFAAEEADITVRGYQQTDLINGRYSIRFVATGIDLAGVDAVGFEVYVDGKSIDRQGNTVYRSLNANYGAEMVTAESYGAEYITGMAITGIPASKGTMQFTVKPYAVKGGVKIYATTQIATVNPEKSVYKLPSGDGLVVDWSEGGEYADDHITYYIDGSERNTAPSKGNYVVYITSSNDAKRAKWNYADWKYEGDEPSESNQYSIYFFTVEELYTSASAMAASAGKYSVGSLVGTEEYTEGSGIGAAIYEIGTVTATGSHSLGSAKYANIVPFGVGSDKIISVDMFGTHANGTQDDANTINKAFGFSNCTVIEFEGSEYLQKTGISISRNNITVNGYGARISNEYTDGAVHWTDLQIINSESLTLKNLTLYLSETKGQGTLFGNNDHVQLLINGASGIVVDNVTVLCPNNTTNDRHVTSIWANKNISDITIQNCTVQNLSKSSVGGGIWVSAGEGKTATDINILNNYIEKSSHDETLAFFIGDFDGIFVNGNYIYTHDEPVGNPSAHAIGFGVWGIASTVKNAVFSNNEVDVVARNDAFVFSSIDGLEIYNNSIILRNNSESDDLVYGVFRVAEPTDTTQKNLKIYNNEITVYNTSNSRMSALAYDMDSNCSIYGNSFVVNSKIEKIVNGTKKDAAFYDNTVEFNMEVSGSYDSYKNDNDITADY